MTNVPRYYCVVRPNIEAEGTKEKSCRGMGREFQRYRESVEDYRARKTGNLAEGARQSSFEKLRFGKLELLLEYCVLHDTTHQYKEQGGYSARG